MAENDIGLFLCRAAAKDSLKKSHRSAIGIDLAPFGEKFSCRRKWCGLAVGFAVLSICTHSHPAGSREMMEERASRDAMVGLPVRPLCEKNYFIMKLHKIPAQIAEPITPEALQAMACISR